jgi:hypothetical protein
MTDINTATRIAVESVRAVADVLGPELAAKDAEITRLRALVEEMGKALGDLVTLNDEHSPFGGELYHDRIIRTWDRARATLAKAKEQP